MKSKMLGVLLALFVAIATVGCAGVSNDTDKVADATSDVADATNGVADAINNQDPTIDVDVNNTVDTVVYPPQVDVNSTNNVYIIYDNLPNPLTTSGTFGDPHELRNETYYNVNGLVFFQGYTHWNEGNVTIESPDGISYLNIVTKEGDLASCIDKSRPYVASYTCEVPASEYIKLELILEDTNGTTMISADILERPTHY